MLLYSLPPPFYLISILLILVDIFFTVNYFKSFLGLIFNSTFSENKYKGFTHSFIHLFNKYLLSV